MKKILAICLSLLALTSCVNDTKNTIRKSVVFCDHGNYSVNPCAGCEKYTKSSLEKYNTVISLTMTDLTNDSYHPHYHYCLVYEEVI